MYVGRRPFLQHTRVCREGMVVVVRKLSFVFSSFMQCIVLLEEKPRYLIKHHIEFYQPASRPTQASSFAPRWLVGLALLVKTATTWLIEG